MQKAVKRYSPVFLILGMAFIFVGIFTDNKTFTAIGLVFTVLSLVTGGRWLGKRR